MAKVTDCLQNAIKLIRANRNIDAEDADVIVAGLQETITNHRGNSEVQLQRTLARMKDANREAANAAIKKAGRERMDRELGVKFLDPETPVDQLSLAWRNYFEYDYRGGPTTDVHLSGHIRQTVQSSLGRLYPVWEQIFRRQMTGTFDSEFAVTFQRQLAGVETGDPLAPDLVRLFNDVTRELIERGRRAGLNIGLEDNWRLTTYNQARISSDIAGYEKFLTERLDPEYHPDPKASAEHIMSSLRRRGVDDEAKARLTAGRQVFFKSPEDYVEHQLRFGDSGYSHSLQDYVRNLAKTVAIAERLGPSPGATVKRISTELKNRVRDDIEKFGREAQTARAQAAKAREAGQEANAVSLERAAAEAERRANTLKDLGQGGIRIPTLETPEALTKFILGEFASPENQTAADWNTGLRNHARAVFLGKTAVAFLVEDQKNVLIRAGALATEAGSSRLGFYRQLAAVMQEGPAREFARQLGFMQHASEINQSVRQVGVFDSVGGTRRDEVFGAGAAAAYRELSARAATAVKTTTGDYFLENNFRAGFAMTVNNFFGAALRKKAFSELSPDYQKFLQSNAIDATTWRKLQRVAEYRPDDMGGGLEVNSLPPDLYPLVMSYLWREVDMAVVYPGQYTRALLARETKAGTWSGEFIRHTSAFLSWPTEFYRSTWRNEINRGTAPAVAFAAASVGTAILYTQLNEVLNGNPPRAADDGEMWTRAIARSGLLGPLGEIALQVGTGAQGSPVEGAPLGLAFEMARGAVKTGVATIEGDTDAAAAAAVKTIDRTLLPNAWWLDGLIINPVVESTLDNLEPGRARARERRYAREGRL